MQWKLISDVILISAFAVFAVFAILALCQLIKRRSLKKVDKQLLWAILPFALMAIAYVVFDKFIVLNTRPNGSGEPSFPSTHVMVVATIFLVVASILPKYIKSKSACVVLDLMMLLLLFLVCAGRVFSKMHWISDVLGGLGFAAIFAGIYYLIIRRYKNG
jgi:undecaprenyl-diphosphatase